MRQLLEQLNCRYYSYHGYRYVKYAMSITFCGYRTEDIYWWYK